MNNMANEMIHEERNYVEREYVIVILSSTNMKF